MISDTDFSTAAKTELERLRAYGFDHLEETQGPGWAAVTVLRGTSFVHLVREVRDQLVYAELGELEEGKLPGWGPGQRTDVRILVPSPGRLGSYLEAPDSIHEAVRDVVDAVITWGLPHLAAQDSSTGRT
jgi:hypothetical protein